MSSINSCSFGHPHARFNDMIVPPRQVPRLRSKVPKIGDKLDRHLSDQRKLNKNEAIYTSTNVKVNE